MTVSFSAAAKAEVCRILPQKHCCALAECFGILLFCNSFSAEGIKIITESREFAYILPKLFKKAFDISFDSYPVTEGSKLVTNFTAVLATVNNIGPGLGAVGPTGNYSLYSPVA